MEIVRCMEDVVGFNLTTPPNFVMQSDYGYVFKATANIVRHAEELCTEDSKIRESGILPNLNFILFIFKQIKMVKNKNHDSHLMF